MRVSRTLPWLFWVGRPGLHQTCVQRVVCLLWNLALNRCPNNRSRDYSIDKWSNLDCWRQHYENESLSKTALLGPKMSCTHAIWKEDLLWSDFLVQIATARKRWRKIQGEQASNQISIRWGPERMGKNIINSMGKSTTTCWGKKISSVPPSYFLVLASDTWMFLYLEVHVSYPWLTLSMPCIWCWLICGSFPAVWEAYPWSKGFCPWIESSVPWDSLTSHS